MGLTDSEKLPFHAFFNGYRNVSRSLRHASILNILQWNLEIYKIVNRV